MEALPLFELLPTELLEGIASQLHVAEVAAFAVASQACAAAARRAVGDPSVAVPAEVARRLLAGKRAGRQACAKCPAMVLPSVGLNSIGGGAFYKCTALTSIALPASITSVGVNAFHLCHALTSIDLPAGLTSIELGTFAWCRALHSLALPTGITSIAASAFQCCETLTTVILPNGLTDIGVYAFYRCPALTMINIPASVQSIGACAFVACPSLDHATRAVIHAISPRALGALEL